MNLNISDQDAEYMYKLVQRVVDEVGPRMSCSPQEAEGAIIIKDELEKGESSAKEIARQVKEIPSKIKNEDY